MASAFAAGTTKPAAMRRCCHYPQLRSDDHFMAKEDLSLESEATEDELYAGS
jgi:hypothetical protein